MYENVLQHANSDRTPLMEYKMNNKSPILTLSYMGNFDYLFYIGGGGGGNCHPL